MTNSPLDQIAKRVTLWGVAFLTVVAVFGFVNKWFILDPMLRAVAEERQARVAADDRIADKVTEIAERQALFTAAATSPPGSIERVWAEAYLQKNVLRIRQPGP